ncbi:MAG: DUF6069 family protein [Pseudonocardiaceae bacterium]
MSLTPEIPTASSSRSVLARSPVWRVGVLASVVAAVVTELFALGARAIHIPMVAGSPGAEAGTAAPIPIGGFAIGTLIWSLVGVVLAVVLARRAKHPARTFVVTTVVLTVLSLAGPAFAVDTATATKVVLALSHLVAAAVVIPPLALRLSHVRPAAGADVD